MGKSKEKKKPSISSTLYSKFLWFDMFGESPSFEIDGNGTYNTLIGTVMSIIILFIVIRYGIRKLNIMRQFNDTNFA